MTQANRPLPLPELATLLVVDVQERLLPAMPAEEQLGLVKQVSNLVALFAERGGSCVYSEQYPRGLGATVAAVAAELALAPNVQRVEKMAFSVCAEESWTPPGPRQDIVLVGMEAHVCVLLTGLDLLARGHRLFVPHDAVASRTARNRDNGLALMAANGAVIVNSETLIFNALGRAGGDVFKRFSARIK